MSADKYPSVFSRQAATIVYLCGGPVTMKHNYSLEYNCCPSWFTLLINGIYAQYGVNKELK